MGKKKPAIQKLNAEIILKEIKIKDIKANWDQLILSRVLRDNLDSSIIWPVLNYGSPRDHGIILFGPPGTGKTTIPYSIAKKFKNWKLYYITPQDFVIENLTLEQSIKKIFVKINEISQKNNAKIIFVFDEIDELVVSRGSDSDRQSRLMTTMMLPLLNDLRKDAEKYGFIFFALTNHISRFDPAIMRKGRFDLILPVGLPDRIMRYKFFEIMINNVKKSYLKNFQVDIRDWRITAADAFEHLVDLNILSTISQRLSFGDIETICKRVVEEALDKDQDAFRDFSKTKNTSTQPYPLYLETFPFLRWINKYLVSSNRNHEEMDRYYQDISIYTRGSSPHSELNQIQPRINQEFESLYIFTALNSPTNKWKINNDNELILEIINLNENNTFDGTFTITITGPKISHTLVPIDLRLQPDSHFKATIPPIKPSNKGTLEINVDITGNFILSGLDLLNNCEATLHGSISKKKTLEIN